MPQATNLRYKLMYIYLYNPGSENFIMIDAIPTSLTLTITGEYVHNTIKRSISRLLSNTSSYSNYQIFSFRCSKFMSQLNLDMIEPNSDLRLNVIHTNSLTGDEIPMSKLNKIFENATTSPIIEVFVSNTITPQIVNKAKEKFMQDLRIFYNPPPQLVPVRNDSDDSSSSSSGIDWTRLGRNQPGGKKRRRVTRRKIHRKTRTRTKTKTRMRRRLH